MEVNFILKMKLNEDAAVVKQVREALKANDGYCPCLIGKTEDTKCICKHFKQEVKAGDFCICELYQKIG